MPLSDALLYRLSRRWPSPLAAAAREFDAPPGTEEYEMAYARKQFSRRVRDGCGLALKPGWSVLEIGCGHGGISLFLACNGPGRVVGLDPNEVALGYAARLQAEIEGRLNARLPIEWRKGVFPGEPFKAWEFDLVVAENAFEHFTDVPGVLAECRRVLKPGGRVLIPIFTSILSKYGPHLKTGLKLPWMNLVWSEKAILAALARAAEDRPELHETYPGLKNDPKRLRDVRRHGDLNDLTYAKFKRLARDAGFVVEWFRPVPNRAGRVLAGVPGLKRTVLADVFSTGASACLWRPDGK